MMTKREWKLRYNMEQLFYDYDPFEYNCGPFYGDKNKTAMCCKMSDRLTALRDLAELLKENDDPELSARTENLINDYKNFLRR